jgi:hypothetical protein
MMDEPMSLKETLNDQLKRAKLVVSTVSYLESSLKKLKKYCGENPLTQKASTEHKN